MSRYLRLRSFAVIRIQDLSGSWCIKGTGKSMTRVDSPVPLMRHDPDRSWITDPDPDHPKGTQPETNEIYFLLQVRYSLVLSQ